MRFATDNCAFGLEESATRVWKVSIIARAGCDFWRGLSPPINTGRTGAFDLVRLQFSVTLVCMKLKSSMFNFTKRRKM